MKRETLRHPKTYDLAARLQITRVEAIGYLTLLWDFTAEQSPEGNVGKWPDGSIARACDWPGDPAEFTAGLTAAGFLDRDPHYRLLVHHWEEHCERWVRAKLAKAGRDFARPTGEPSECTAEPTVEATKEATTEAPPPRDQTKPIQTKPPPPTPSTPDGVTDGEEGGGGCFAWDDARRALAATGIGNVAGTLREAREHGLQADQVLALIEHYRAAGGAWKPGALVWRITHGAPEQAADQGWPAKEQRPKVRGPTVHYRQGQATRIITRLRRAGKGDDEIASKLQEAGLEWP